MNMPGYMPTEEDVAEMVRDLEKSDPENANPEYARQMLIKMKLMYRELGRIDEELLHKEMGSLKSASPENRNQQQ
jgi:RNA polymerase-interacting CarD/CdnL/TRCF family regulator